MRDLQMSETSIVEGNGGEFVFAKWAGFFLMFRLFWERIMVIDNAKGVNIYKWVGNKSRKIRTRL